ncbi:MAG TPA: hypothetical protein VMR62_10490 [Bryobacteraceae bacterium]|nr:hypothetical protein [Bryobacteraceae bacterium]
MASNKSFNATYAPAQPAKRKADEDERRRYYRISRLGHRVLKAEAERLAGLVELSRARKLLPEGHA